MKTKMIAVLMVFTQGCLIAAEPPPAPAAGYCTPPATDSPGCVTEGDSPYWGPGPNTYCTEPDNTEWHIYKAGANRYTKETGTAHSPDQMVCGWAPIAVGSVVAN